MLASTALLLPVVAPAATFTVTNAGDTGTPGQFRVAITLANTNAGEDTITFNVSPTITSSISITDGLTLGGAGAVATIAGGGALLFNGAGSLTGNVGSNLTLTN